MNIKGITPFNGREKIGKLVLPGFDGVPISHVISFVIKGFRKGVLVTRASSIAFNRLFLYQISSRNLSGFLKIFCPLMLLIS
jgi:hypothetical protein